jgi:hypothetical protein
VSTRLTRNERREVQVALERRVATLLDVIVRTETEETAALAYEHLVDLVAASHKLGTGSGELPPYAELRRAT